VYRLSHIFLILIAYLGLMQQAEAQSSKLAVSHILNFPDTIYEGVAYSNILVVVSNEDTIQDYQGSISVNFLTDSINVPVQLSPGSTNFLLAPGDTAVFIINNYIFDPSAFKAGENIVVVWPVANVNDVDSLYTPTYFVHTADIKDPLSLSELSIYPNPAQEYIIIKNTSGLDLEQVRIYIMDGRLAGIYEQGSGILDIRHLPEGVYHIYFYHKKGISVRRFIRQ
jgi:hypothetical protein